MNFYDEKDFKGRLSEEYKILQDKIDKIGAFRFTIKGWSITAVIAASAAASGKSLLTAFTISVGLVLMLFFFFLLEYEQVRCSRLFGDRAGRLEDAFKKISLGIGKGIPGALLMANLQAAVRSQCATASQDIPQFLKSVKQSFYESTDEGGYATLFFGDYQDSTGRLRFTNCGHNPPFLVRSDGTVERLAATATVLGLFETWESCAGGVTIGAGDVLVIYTDGVTEASNSAGEEFGENRMLETIRGSITLPVPQIVNAIFAAALDFSNGEMRDDLTLVVARGRLEPTKTLVFEGLPDRQNQGAM